MDQKSSKQVNPALPWIRLVGVLLIATVIPGMCFNTMYDRNARARNRQSRSADCTGSSPKNSFPDLDYALMGYNIIKGYPQSFGHDPGFTYPIFKADYSRGQQSADCRYNVPYGYLIIPDISCPLAFSSSIIETTYELFQSLLVYIDTGMECPSFYFKASAEYKKTSSSILNGEFLYIITKAKCQYYFAQLDTENPPDFSNSFLTWAKKLSESSDRKLYMDFFDRFGTHFSKEVVFGAEYVLQYKMESRKFNEEKTKGVDIKASSIYSSELSVNERFSLEDWELKAASAFNKLVSTETLTNGPSPAFYKDSLNWASTVQDNPVPIKYKLAPITDLFTERYMFSQSINYAKVFSNLQNYSKEYCHYIQKNGYIDRCEDDDGQKQLISTKLSGRPMLQLIEGLPDCIARCQQTDGCLAITYDRKEQHSNKQCNCFLFNGVSNVYGTKDHDWETILFRQAQNSLPLLTLHNTNIEGRIQDVANKIMSKDDCQKWCMERPSCAGFSICECAGGVRCYACACKLFAIGEMRYFYGQMNATSVVVIKRVER